MSKGAKRTKLWLIAAVLMLGVLAAGAGAWVITRPSASPGEALSLPATFPAATKSHIVVIVLENREASEAIGSPEAPYLTSLAKRYALATSYFGVTHPSLPNYLALTGGSTFRISSDCVSCSVNGANLVDQLEAAHVSWKAYMEGMPRPCDLTAGVRGYAKKHDPFLYYDDVSRNPERCRKVVPYQQLGFDLRQGRLPTFAWITPNLCDDGHDCGLSDVDRFLRNIVPALIEGLGDKGALFITWDEGSSDEGCCHGLANGGRVATILASPLAKRGSVASGPYDHYSLLRTIEDMLRLPHLRQAGSKATKSLRALFASGHAPALKGKAR